MMTLPYFDKMNAVLSVTPDAPQKCQSLPGAERKPPVTNLRFRAVAPASEFPPGLWKLKLDVMQDPVPMEHRVPKKGVPWGTRRPSLAFVNRANWGPGKPQAPLRWSRKEVCWQDPSRCPGSSHGPVHQNQIS